MSLKCLRASLLLFLGLVSLYLYLRPQFCFSVLHLVNSLVSSGLASLGPSPAVCSSFLALHQPPRPEVLMTHCCDRSLPRPARSAATSPTAPTMASSTANTEMVPNNVDIRGLGTALSGLERNESWSRWAYRRGDTPVAPGQIEGVPNPAPRPVSCPCWGIRP